MEILIVILVGIILIAVLSRNLSSNVEKPDYKIFTSKGSIEVRDYAPMLIAEVEVVGERKQAIGKGFRVLADYIFGNNISNKKMEVIKSDVKVSSEKISMTAPVMQQQNMDNWKVRFVMPKKYSLETLPKPNSKNVQLILLPKRRFAVIRFSGLMDDENINKHLEDLKAYILKESLEPIGEPIFAFYNPPWTLSFLRRNEIMIEIGTI